MSSAPVALILGAGANIGLGVARALTAKGYKVALASRTEPEKDAASHQLHVKGDFANPESILDIFSKVEAQLGLPHVVVYNAAGASPHSAEDPLGVPLATFARDLAVNTTSAFVAAQQAVRAFERLPASASRTFIYTGNALNTFVWPAMLTLGAGKSSTAHIIEVASVSYKDKGFKFYYADQRNADGSPANAGISGEAAAEFYTSLTETTSQGPWQQTFVKGAGYAKF